MLAHLPRLPFSLDPLIREAKRRARRRRFAFTLLIAVIAGGLAGAVLAFRSPGGPSGADSGAAASSGASKPPVTSAMVTAAHQDELRMLSWFVPPPGAQPLAREPTLLKRLGTQIFGLHVKRFIRYRFWLVPASVKTVINFEKTHPPGGFRLQDCARHQSAFPSNTVQLCGGVIDLAPSVPLNRSLIFMFPNIHGLVSSRRLDVEILRLPSHRTAIRAVAINRAWIPDRFRGHAPQLPKHRLQLRLPRAGNNP